MTADEYNTAINDILRDITAHIPGECLDEEIGKFEELRKSMGLSWTEFVRKVLFVWSIRRGEE